MPETFDPGKVDLVSIPKSGSVVDLHIVQDNAWIGSDDQLTTLQQKINNYVSFAVDGALLANYPETAGLPWRIVIVSREGQPDPRTSFVLDQITSAVRQYGGELVVQATAPRRRDRVANYAVHCSCLLIFASSADLVRATPLPATRLLAEASSGGS